MYVCMYVCVLVRATTQQMRSPSLSSSSNQTPPPPPKGGGGGGKKVEAATPCCSKVGLKRGPWTVEEDKLLSDYIKREGEGRWRTLPKKAGLLRCGKSCRLRWMNYLRPSVKRGHISSDEEDLILRLHRLLGNRWSLIAGRIPGRTDNEIKNYWNTHLSKKLISQGIDPKTHKPFLLPSLNPNKPEIVKNKLLDHHHSSSSTVVDHQYDSVSNINYVPFALQNSTNLQIGDGMMDSINIHHEQFVEVDDGPSKTMINNEDINGVIDDDDDHMMMSSCNEDAFSTFLNSLINDDMFNTIATIPQHIQDNA
ncbi:hypothetical protein MIMGU_mgv1a010579mg [Erythranthe guttata]|uniref:Uncharacterized protein n=1 Tax=Erythranthe guttata TaxID=4155 RepID=A0A022RFX3_ERYGU|nr:PREDICTED: transcription repressor MYB5-like [Erythranthe guttata]EYU39257.1 hypothetical protein MIMGU_mgv1a010579mg [Erythranthe guttata]|eukprot:XP_012835287.1 PREDICTED: transcription repressor MYB5-like [Erythranthe guttata]